jgi:excisionase family DNA binding protein
MSDAGILTVDDIAAFLRVTPTQVRELLDAGELAGFKVAGAWRVPTAAVTEYLRRGMEAAQLQALSRGLTDPRAWAKALAGTPELRAALEAQNFGEGTLGAFLKDALRQVELESKADNVVLFKPKPE